MREIQHGGGEGPLEAMLERRAAEAPPVSPLFLGAVRRRRTARRARAVGVSVCTLALMAAAWISFSRRGVPTGHGDGGEVALRPGRIAEPELPTLGVLRMRGVAGVGSVAWAPEETRSGEPTREPLRAGDSADAGVIASVLRGL
jgi:hypothetical protein